MKSRIMSALVDTLVNSMETFMDSNDFEEYLNDEYDIDSSVAKRMFADYWKISANDRFEWDYPEWSRWLKGYGIRETVMKIEKKKEIVEIQEEVRIPQGDHDLILEKGDKIEVVEALVGAVKTKNGWSFVPKDTGFSMLPTLEINTGRAVVVISYDRRESVPFQVAMDQDLSDPQFDEFYWDFANARLVKDFVAIQWRLRVDDSELSLLVDAWNKY